MVPLYVTPAATAAAAAAAAVPPAGAAVVVAAGGVIGLVIVTTAITFFVFGVGVFLASQQLQKRLMLGLHVTYIIYIYYM